MAGAVGIDPSLTGLGLAHWAPTDGWDSGLVKSKGRNDATTHETHTRLQYLLAQAMDFVYTHSPDLAVVESPAYSSSTGHATDRAGLYWLLLDRLAHAGVPYATVKGNTRIRYGLGKGSGDKDVVLAAVIRRYPDADVVNNNVADAVLLADMGCQRLLQQGRLTATYCPVPLTHMAAMDAAMWPTLAP